MKRFERQWMYERVETSNKIRCPSENFVNGVMEFIEHARQQEDYKVERKISCPCGKCKNTKILFDYEVRNHLYQYGFCPNYYDWVCHGESFTLPNQEQDHTYVSDNTYRDMVVDALEDRVFGILEEPPPEGPNSHTKPFFDMLKASEKPLYEGSKMSLLEAAARIVTLKSEYNLPHKCVDGIASLIEDVIPPKNVMTRSFYNTKKIVKGLELPCEKIHACQDGCMLFWGNTVDAELTKCRKCSKERYKTTFKGKKIPHKVLTYFPIGPRLQRLYATKKIAAEMRWHKENPRVSGKMAHPSDGEAWKHFDRTYPDFAKESRNVRLGLCTDGFAPFGQFGKSYSCWPVMLTPYNLPPWLCMKRQFIFLSLIIPGPKNPKQNLDVYLQPLIRELNELWINGLGTYDVSLKQNFQLKASLMWTINDFPAYGMLSGWGTAGLKACPYCMEKRKSFSLPYGKKVSWFDCHRQFLPRDHAFRRNKTGFLKNRVEHDDPPRRLSGEELWRRVSEFPDVVEGTEQQFKELKKLANGWNKRSIFWELPYWKTLLIRHNLDVMHIEKNFFEQLIHTVMDVKSKTADTIRTRRDLPKYCHRRTLHIDNGNVMPKASFTLDKNQKKVLCEWVSNLRFPDGYASNLSRCVDMKECKLHGLKSHDCHVFMERLLPVALKNLLPTKVWNAITEISLFFRDLCASTITTEDVVRLDNKIAEILCKLELIFPPSFFNSMEHLPIHLPYEAKVGGPVQYRWMYPFERFLNNLKRKIGNKARVEGSICNAYLNEEIANFCSFYFEQHIDTKANDLVVGSSQTTDSDLPECFQSHGDGSSSKGKSRFLNEDEYEQAHLYILSNIEILREYEELFEQFILQEYPNASIDEVWTDKFEAKYPAWFKEHVIRTNIKDDLILALAMGPSMKVTTWNRYSINGYKFQTLEYGRNKSTMNYGVCVKSTREADFYGILEEVIELNYYGHDRIYKSILFKCAWMDNSPTGMNVHKLYKLVEVNRKGKYHKKEPFVLAHQANQVYFASYPSTSHNKKDWEAVFKTKSRSDFDAEVDANDIYQEEVVPLDTTLSTINVDDIIDEDDINTNDDEIIRVEDEEEEESDGEEGGDDEEEDDEEEEDEEDDDEEEDDEEDDDNDTDSDYDVNDY